MFGLVLLIGIPVEMVTGLLSYAAYNPNLAGNDPNPDHGVFGFYLFNWLTSPSWAYRLIEGVHVILGLALVPIVLAKLWSVMPQLFAWPPFRSLARLLERVTLLMLVGGVIFEITTGVLEIGYFNLGSASTRAHFYGAWIFITAFIVHARPPGWTSHHCPQIARHAGPSCDRSGPPPRMCPRRTSGVRSTAEPTISGAGRVLAKRPSRLPRSWPTVRRDHRRIAPSRRRRGPGAPRPESAPITSRSTTPWALRWRRARADR